MDMLADVGRALKEGLTVPEQGDRVPASTAIGDGLEMCRIGVSLEDPLLGPVEAPISLLVGVNGRVDPQGRIEAATRQEIYPPSPPEGQAPEWRPVWISSAPAYPGRGSPSSLHELSRALGIAVPIVDS